MTKNKREIFARVRVRNQTYPNTDYFNYVADCSEFIELFKSGYCRLESGIVTTPPPKVHSLAISREMGWNFDASHSAKKLMMTAYYPVDSQKSGIEPKEAKKGLMRPRCSYKNTGDEADFKKNSPTG